MRAEVIISKSDYESYKKGLFPADYPSSPRNLVAGLLNTKRGARQQARSALPLRRGPYTHVESLPRWLPRLTVMAYTLLLKPGVAGPTSHHERLRAMAQARLHAFGPRGRTERAR